MASAAFKYCMSPNQQRRHLPSLLYDSYSTLWLLLTYLVIGIGSDFLKYPDQKSNFLKNLRLKNKILKQQHYMYIAIFCIAKNFSGMGILMVDTFCEPT